jgi:glutamyl/glutaminyl-tRNA synthetase
MCHSLFTWRCTYAPPCSAEEHLPNTLRQVLIYDALGFPRPLFSHVSLILAPDKSKLSKRCAAFHT